MNDCRIRELCGSALLTERFRANDDLLEGITLGELVTTIQANESTIDKSVVLRVYKDLLKAKLDDAEYELNKNMKAILAELK